MRNERWKTIESLYLAAADLEKSARARFLENACQGDGDLQREIESLLLHDELHGSSLDRQAPYADLGRSTPVIGTKLAHYEITAYLASGGMGDVYQATDTKLCRSVAIKFLPEAFTDDSERVARFQREARVLASLNHPNIAAIHGLEESGGRKFLVMELVDGETLAERIKRGSIPVAEALPIARQIAEALEAAHDSEKGIIHRDLKPANVKITPDGKVKVLDFGLAKAFVGETAKADLSNSPTLSVAATNGGVILGTAAYMSPEQAKGAVVDRRTDIFAFGCVLYEMLTARQAFHGDTLAETLAAVLKAEPDWSRLPKHTPPSVRRLLRRCLQKDRSRRLQTAGDARIELLDSGTETDVATVPGAVRHPWRERIAWAGMAIAIAVAVFFAMSRPSATSTGDLTRFNIYAPEKTVFAGTSVLSIPEFALSPDARYIVFAAGAPGVKPMLWLRSMEDLSERPLPGTENGEFPFWSPDGSWIGFFAADQLKKVSPADGRVLPIADVLGDTRGGSWGRDDTILYGTGFNTLYRISPGAAPVAIGKLDDERQEGSHRWPNFLPDGNHFLFTTKGGMTEQNAVFVGSLDGTTAKRLVRSDAGAFYASGYLLFLDVEGNAKAQAFDVASLELSGQPFSIPASVGRTTTGYPALSVSRGGALAYSSALLSQGQLTWIDRSGKPSGKVGPEGDYPDFRLSHNWNRLASSLIDAKTRNIDISVTDLAQGGIQASDRTQKFTFGPAINAAAVWSPDDALIAYRTTRTGRFIEFYKKSSAGGGKEEPVLLKDAMLGAGGQSLSIFLTDWTLKGLFYTETSWTGSSLWRLPFGGDGKPVRLIYADKALLMHGNVSPDGRMVAYTSNESGQFEVWVQTVPASDWRHQVSIDGGYEPRWRADGSELYFLSKDRKLMFVTAGPNLSFGIPRELFQTRVPADVRFMRTHYVPNRDGSRFLVDTQVGEPAPTPITIVLNWIHGLKK